MSWAAGLWRLICHFLRFLSVENDAILALAITVGVWYG